MRTLSHGALMLLLIGFSGLVSCQQSLKIQGSREGYFSVRLVDPDPRRAPAASSRKAQANRRVQEALGKEFRANGFKVDPENADLTVAYLLITQDRVSTSSISEYFGYGRSPLQITEAAHRAGVLKGKTPEIYEKGAVIVDIIDSKTKKLVYRNYAVRDISESSTEAEKKARTESAVHEALEDFFRR